MATSIAFDIAKRLGTAYYRADGEIITDPDGIDSVQDDAYFIQQVFNHFRESQVRDLSEEYEYTMSMDT